MKKICVYATVAALASTTAMASKSRLQSLGEDKDGSYYISDTRNVFINPSELNNFSNRVFFEWGGAGSAFGSNATLDRDHAPKAQGGVFHDLSNGMKLGVNLGDETDVAALTRMLASNGSTAFMQTADNVLDLFLAGKGSVNWGANLLYTQSESEETSARYKQHAYAVRFGASQDAWNAHALVALGAKAEAPDLTGTPVYKGKIGVRVGGGYDLSSDNKAFVMYERYGWDQTLSGNKREGSFNKSMLGLGHTKKITDSSSLFAKLHGELINIELDTNSVATTKASIKRLAVPVTIGFEHTATDWLVLRGSVGQNLYGNVKDSGLGATGNFTAGTGPTIRALAAARYNSSSSGNGGKKTLPTSTVVNAGMTLKFGKLELDGNIGTTGGDRGTGDISTTSGTNKGVLALDNLESRVGMTYNF